MKLRLTENHLKVEYERMRKKATFDFDYIISGSLSILICLFGFIMDSSTVIIGSMLISPFLYPILSIANSLVWGDYKYLISRLVKFVLTGVFFVVVIAVLSQFFEVDVEGVEFVSRVTNNIQIYFYVALLSGIATTFAFYWPGVIEAITGASISVALLPPMVMIGVASANNSTDDFQRSMLIFFLNLLGIFIGSLITILFLKLTDKKEGEL